MQLSFIFYILISVIVISGSMYLNSTTGSMSKAAVMSLLFLLISIFFGMRWFTPSGESNIGTNISTTWPPPNSINMCPDYTVLSSDMATYPTWTCTDKIGVRKNGEGNQINLNSGPTNTNPGYYSVSDLCRECNRLGLTWEGVCIPNSDNPINASVSPPRPA